MATCKDCLYYEPCSVLNAEFKKRPKDFIETDLCATQCTTFKDRSRFVELPCEVGDTVYCLAKPSKRRITKISITTYGLRLCVNDMFCFDESQIGKTVFLTREEAEQALKEREQRNNTN